MACYGVFTYEGVVHDGYVRDEMEVSHAFIFTTDRDMNKSDLCVQFDVLANSYCRDMLNISSGYERMVLAVLVPIHNPYIEREEHILISTYDRQSESWDVSPTDTEYYRIESDLTRFIVRHIVWKKG